MSEEQVKTIRVFRDERPASQEEVEAAIAGKPLPKNTCADCGTTDDLTYYINSVVAGHWEYLCPDCKMENDPQNVMVEPCPDCHGRGDTIEGFTCDLCEGSGVFEL